MKVILKKRTISKSAELKTAGDTAGPLSAEARLRDNEERFRLLVEQINQGIFQSTLDGRLLHVNPAALEIFGLGSVEEALSTPVIRLYADPRDCETLVSRLLADGSVKDREVLARRKDGSRFWLCLRAVLLRDERGDPATILGSIEDVTARRQADERVARERARAEQYFSIVPSMILALDREGRVVHINDAGCRLLGYERSEITGRDWFEGFLPDTEAMRVKDVFKRLLAGETERFEYNENDIISRSGAVKTVRWHNAVMRDTHGAITGTLSAAEDVTERRQAEREMRDSQERFLRIFQYSAAGMVLVGTDLRFKKVNDAFCRMLGYAEHELLAKTFQDVTYPEDRSVGDVLVRETLAGRHETFQLEKRYVRKDGGIIWGLVSSTLMRDALGLPQYFVTQIQDITETKRAEAEIARTETRLKSLVRILQSPTETIQQFLDLALNEAIGLTESAIGYIYHYDETRRQFTLNTWSREVMSECGIQNPERIYDLDKTGIWGEAVRQRKPIIVNDFPAPHPLKKDYPEGYVPLKKFLTVPVFDAGRIVAVIGVANKAAGYDASDALQLMLLMDAVWKVVGRKRAEEALRASEERYRRIVENALVGIGGSSGESVLFANRALLDIFGYETQEELKAVPFFDLVTEGSRQVIRERMEKITHGKTVPPVFEYDIRRKDGSVRTLLATSTYYMQDNQRVTFSIFQDITDRKRAEERLRQSEIRYRELFEHINAGVAVYEAVDGGDDFIFRDFNRAGEKIDHVSRERLIGRRLLAMRPGVADFGLLAVLRQVWRTGQPASHPVTFYQDEKLTGWYENFIYKLPSGEIVAVFEDATERKRTNEELRISELRLSSAMKIASLGHWEYNVASSLYHFTDNFYAIFGTTAARVGGYGMTPADYTERFIHPDDRSRFADVMERSLESGDPGHSASLEHRVIRENGSIGSVSVRLFVIKDERGRTVKINGISQDITERKEAEERVAASLREKTLLIKEIHHRIRNNLQVVMSLLNLQADHLADSAAQSLCRETQLRIRSMALIHERLYQSADLATVDFKEYIGKLAADLFRAFRVNVDIVGLRVSSESIVLGIEEAIPCGLIINELLINSLKHAFPAGRTGCITVSLERVSDDRLLLTVADDGVGLGEDINVDSPRSLGFSLVNALAEQLVGEVMLEREKGLAVKILFDRER